ncbi:MAG: GNAT family N-acetyltransferase [Proteobacteria bacterium]|nr:GNAT family N-acetyltransferase [Pseudomonadota bacterium]
MSADIPARKDNVAGAAMRVLAGTEAWDALAGLAATPYQSTRWLRLWLEANSALDPFRVLAIRDSSGIRHALPLVLRRKAGLVLAAKPGDAHAGFYFPPMREDAPSPPVPALPRGALAAALREGGIDALLLADTLASWRERPSPLFSLASPAPDSAYFLALDAADPLAGLLDRDERKKHRQKRAKLASLGEIVSEWVNADEVPAFLDRLFAWKAAQFAATGVADPFSEAAIRRFFVDAAKAQGPLRLFALRAGARPLAILVGAAGDGHFSGMVTAYDPAPDIARNSPGDLMLADLIPALKARGFTSFDLGAGDARYKQRYCPRREPLFDIALGASWPGALAARLWLGARAVKRFVKAHPALLAGMRRLRRR